MLDAIFRKLKQAKPLKPVEPKTEWEIATQPVQPLTDSRSPISSDGKLVVASAPRFPRALKYIIPAIVLIAIGIGGLEWWLSVSSADHTELRLEGQSTVKLGERTTFTVVIANKQKKQELRDVSLTFRADDGTEFVDAKPLALYQNYLSAISPMSDHQEQLRATFWGKQGEERTIEVVARYRIGDRPNRLEKSQTIRVSISDEAILLTVSLPQQVIGDQTFRSSVAYRKLTANDWTNGRLELIQPEGFSLVRSDPELKTVSTLAWPWEVLAKQENNKVVFDGKLADAEGQIKEFATKFFVTVRNAEVLVAETKEDLSVISNPLALTITASEDPNYAPLPGSIINYRINFKNNYDVSLEDVVIQADPSDGWFASDSLLVMSGGFYSSRDKRIVWNGGTTPQLLALNPRESGSVSFRVNLKDDYPKGATEQIVTVRAVMSASNKPKEVGTIIQTEAMLETKIQGKLIVTPRLVFRDDPQTGFTNSGAMPLRAGQATQYSLYLTIQAIANPFEDISFKTILPANITFDGKIKGEVSGTNFVYNPRTGEMSWSFDRLEASGAKTIVLQLTAIPSSDQISKLITILDTSSATATDVFTNTSVEVKNSKILSDLPDDDTVDYMTGRVTP